MKKVIFTHIFFCLLIGLLTLCSCNQNPSSKRLHQELPTPTRQVSDGISLDGDKVWKANEATTLGVKNMISILHKFQSTDDIETYETLHKQMEDEILLIFTKCNMTGEGHNQLHNFLLPIHAQLEPLKSKDLATCQTAFITLRKQLAIYPLYFE